MIHRRRFLRIIGVSLIAAPLVGEAQPREKLPRVGVLEPGRAPGGSCVPSFRQGLQDLGYVEGQTIIFDFRFADEDPDRIPILAADLVRQRPDVLWTHSPAGAWAAKQATTTIPIVVGVAGYLVEQGLAANLARPGSNVTGVELADIELGGKRLQLLKEAVPTIARVAVLVDSTMRIYDGVPRNFEPEARSLGVRLQRVEARSSEAFEDAFVAMVRGRADALIITDVPLFIRNSQRLFLLALRHRLPTIAGWRRYAEAGSLIAYGAYVPDVCRRSAAYVDKILKGAKPADMPIEQPARFELAINLKTAKALGLTIPPSVLARADHVIQ
jgi:putative ABC transport system substrate-binding protein